MADLFTDYQNNIENDNSFTDPSSPSDGNIVGNETITPAPAPVTEQELPTVTPVPMQDNTVQGDAPATPEGETVLTPTPAPEDKEISDTYSMDDIYTLLSDWNTQYKEELEAQQTFRSEVSESQKHLTAQSNNLLSVSTMVLLSVAFLSGILLARAVWRKL